MVLTHKIVASILIMHQSLVVAMLASAVLPENRAVITEWPDYLYGEAFPGATFPQPISRETMVAYQQRALTMTLRQAEISRLDETMRVELDWVFALIESQKELIRKPVEEWTIKDICNLSSWLTRLTAKQPGAFRKEPVFWNLRELSPKEEVRLATLASRSFEELSAEEKELLACSTYQFIRHDDIERALQGTLEFIASQLKEALTLPVKERAHRYLGIGSSVHFEIVKIHPFQEGSKRLGRMMMYIIWAQRGLAPVPFFDPSYVDSLMEALQRGHALFLNYVAKRYYLFFILRACPSYYTIINDVSREAASENGDFRKILLNHPLVRAYMQETNRSRTLELAGAGDRQAGGVEKNCHYCQKCPPKEKPFQKCSSCKNVVYCSRGCQAADWKQSHKEHCVKKESM